MLKRALGLWLICRCNGPPDGLLYCGRSRRHVSAAGVRGRCYTNGKCRRLLGLQIEQRPVCEETNAKCINSKSNQRGVDVIIIAYCALV